MAQIIYGIHPVQEALRVPHLQFERVWIGTPRPHGPLQSVVALASERKVPVSVAPRESLEQMARGCVHQNVVAVIRDIPYVEVEDLLGRSKREGDKLLLLILDGIQDPQNFGALIRTALGCGAHGIIIPKDRSVGITPAVIKASAGGVFYLPVARVVNLANTLDRLRDGGIRVYGASGGARDVVFEADFDVDLAVVLGAEGKGLRALTMKKCDCLFAIPMKGPLSSFNVSVSGGILLYEVMRQRHLRLKGSP